MYYDTEGRLHSVLASWTDVAKPDLFAQAAADRSWFRADDLQRLSVLLDGLLRDLRGVK
jgi:hypothetical protein